MIVHRAVEHALGLGGLLQLVVCLAKQPQIAGADAHHLRVALHRRRQAGDEGFGGEVDRAGARIILGPQEAVALGPHRVGLEPGGFEA